MVLQSVIDLVCVKYGIKEMNLKYSVLTNWKSLTDLFRTFEDVYVSLFSQQFLGGVTKMHLNPVLKCILIQFSFKVWW